MKTKFILIKNNKELKEIHKLFSEILEEMKKYYCADAIVQGNEENVWNKFVDKYRKKNNYAFGLYLDNKLIGFQLMYVDLKVIFLEWSGVSKGYRGKGFGKLIKVMLDKFIENNQLGHKIMCDCLTSNTESIANLKSSGYKKVAEFKNHWCRQDYFIWEKIVYNSELSTGIGAIG